MKDVDNPIEVQQGAQRKENEAERAAFMLASGNTAGSKIRVRVAPTSQGATRAFAAGVHAGKKEILTFSAGTRHPCNGPWPKRQAQSGKR